MICINWWMNRVIYMVFECVFSVSSSFRPTVFQIDSIKSSLTLNSSWNELIFSALSGNLLFFLLPSDPSRPKTEAKFISRIWSKMIQNTVMFKWWINSNINNFHSFNLQPFDWPTFHGRAETCQSNKTKRSRKNDSSQLLQCLQVYYVLSLTRLQEFLSLKKTKK